MTPDATILFILMAVAFCVGVYVFFRLCARRPARAARVGWLVSAGIVLALGWAAFALDLPSRVLIFTGLILPLWLMGALLGLFAGLIRYRNSDT